MIRFIYWYIDCFEEYWIIFGILWVLLIFLARTKFEMHWLDIWIPLGMLVLWGVFEILKHFVL